MMDSKQPADNKDSTVIDETNGRSVEQEDEPAVEEEEAQLQQGTEEVSSSEPRGSRGGAGAKRKRTDRRGSGEGQQQHPPAGGTRPEVDSKTERGMPHPEHNLSSPPRRRRGQTSARGGSAQEKARTAQAHQVPQGYSANNNNNNMIMGSGGASAATSPARIPVNELLVLQQQQQRLANWQLLAHAAASPSLSHPQQQQAVGGGGGFSASPARGTTPLPTSNSSNGTRMMTSSNSEALLAYYQAAMGGQVPPPSTMASRSYLTSQLLSAGLFGQQQQQQLHQIMLFQQQQQQQQQQQSTDALRYPWAGGGGYGNPMNSLAMTRTRTPMSNPQSTAVQAHSFSPSSSSSTTAAAPQPPHGNAGGRSIRLFQPLDEETLSGYQCLARKNIELFAANVQDVETGAQGRNRKVLLGQVGIRCIHCRSLHPSSKARGAAYYPSKLTGLYQAAQNMASGHFCKYCETIPGHMRQEFLVLKDRKSSAGTGKAYWAEGVRALGVVEHGEVLRFASDLRN